MMIRSAILSLVLAAAPAPAFADDQSTLRHLKTVLWPTAYRTQDTALLDTLLHDSFELIAADGTRSTKQDELDYIQNHHWNPSNFKYTITRLDIYDDAFAIVAGTGEADTYRYELSNVLVKEDGKWQAVASHVSGYESKESSD